MQAELKKFKLFGWKKKLTNGDGWKRSIKEVKALTGPDKKFKLHIIGGN